MSTEKKILPSLGIPFPPTAAGSFVLASGLVLLVRGLAGRNPYEIVLSFAALGVFFVLFFAGSLAARGISRRPAGWTAPAAPSAGNHGEPHLASGLEGRPPYFFRLHFSVRGSLELGGGRKILISGGCASDGHPAAEFHLPFPLSGVFHGRGRRVLRDVFGLFVFPAGPEIHRSFPVLPSPYHRKPRLRIEAYSGAEEKQNRRNADEERYYMREYAPGDRFRDINWKTSSRLAQLVTRVSPFTQERTRTVHVEFRGYGPETAPSLLALRTLDRMKSRLLVFLRTLKEEHPEYLFRIRTGLGDRNVETDRDMEEFAADLAGSAFLSAPRVPAAPGDEFAGGELYLFTSSYDLALPGLLSSRGEGVTHLFFTAPAGEAGGNTPKDQETQPFRLRELFREGCLPGPGIFFQGKKHPLLKTVPRPARGPVEIDYAEVRP